MLKTNVMENWDDGQFPTVFCWWVTYETTFSYMHAEVTMLWASSSTVREVMWDIITET